MAVVTAGSISKLPVRQVMHHDYVEWKRVISKLPVRQVMHPVPTSLIAVFSKLPVRQVIEAGYGFV